MPPTFSSAPQLLTLKGRFWMTELSNNSPFCEAFLGPPTSQGGGGIWTKGTGSQNPRAGNCQQFWAVFLLQEDFLGDTFFHKLEFQIQNWHFKKFLKLKFLWTDWIWRRKVRPLPLPRLCSPWFGMHWSPQEFVLTPVHWGLQALQRSCASCCCGWDRPSQDHSTTTTAWTPPPPNIGHPGILFTSIGTF